jgi:ribonuclease HI
MYQAIKFLIFSRFHDILKTKSVKLYLIPSHVGIRGNEKVDALAKQSLNFQNTKCYLLVILDRL